MSEAWRRLLRAGLGQSIPEIKLSLPSSSALCMQEAVPMVFRALFVLICTLEDPRSAPRTGCLENMHSQGAPRMFFSSPRHDRKGKSVSPGELGYSGLCGGPAVKCPKSGWTCAVFCSVQGGRGPSYPSSVPSVLSQSGRGGPCSHQAFPRCCTCNLCTKILNSAKVILLIL